uniref:amino acid adenylation domain-containing protein n=1 Tax=Methanobrevibacter sp. TaxID=66852 RepID=UPI00388F9043
DKRALPEINLTSLRAEYVAPRNKVEKDIVDAFEKVFGQNKISIYDDFTRLGGDSLTAINLLTSLGDYNLSAGDILSLRTPHAIADVINKNNVEFDLDVYSIDSGCPLNEYQLNVYLDIVVNEKTDAYLIPINMEFSNDYSLNEIIAGLNEMFEIHPILNMCISDEYDVPYMVGNSKPDVIVESGVDDDFILEFLTRSFDLHKSLCRFLVIENDDSYELYAVFHHILCDARSCVVFKENLLAVLNGQSLEVDDSFLKVSAFTQQIQESEIFTKASDFYDNMLVESNEVGGLLDSINADGPGTAQIGLDLDSSIFLNQTEISENVLFTSVFAYTLSRFTGNDNALFSILDNGRDRFDDFNAFGMYVNTLPLLADCSDRDISSFIEYMSSLIYEVKSYNYYPFRLLAKEYDIDANILFQFIPEWMENDDGNVREVYEKLGIIRKMDDLIADLTFEVLKKDNEYYLNVIYCDKYSKEFIDHFIQSYKLILHGILDADKLSEINYISDDDIKLLDGYNQTDCSLHYDDILDAFNDNLLKYPQNELVSYKDVSYSYAEGAYIADVISKKLLDLGVEMQESISFLVPRSELYMFCILGIMSIGGVYVPLDENLPDERIKFMINDTESKVVIVSDETYERGCDLAENCIILNISDIIKCEIKSLSKLNVSYGDLACILYTSGSTGIPKGVKITRKSIINFIDFHVHDLEISHGDVYGLFASIGFDVAMAAIFSAIYSGACLNVIPDDIKLNIKLLNDHIIRHDITHSFITTQIAKLFISEIEETSLKVLVSAGEKLGQMDEIRDYRIVDGYGPTEACVYVISVDTKDKIDYSSVGHVLINTKAYILDKEFRRVPIGAVGELYLSGYQLADGYLNRPEETNKSFFNNPFEENDKYGGLYCTGDVVRLLPDGTYGIIGRRDSQIKVRGNRIELSEVEAAIREMDIIDDVTVQVININENNELIAYVVSDESDEEHLKDLVCDYVGKHKPDYMIPSFLMKLETIPLNVNGKVNKRALPEVDMDSLHAEYVAPTNETEKQIVTAFEVAFNQKGIGLNDDFVRLGGDSITAIRLISL